MKKLLSTLSILGIFLPFFEVAKANEYKFFKTTNMIPTDTATPTIKFYGVSSSGTETLLNTWESGRTEIANFSQFQGSKEHLVTRIMAHRMIES